MCYTGGDDERGANGEKPEATMIQSLTISEAQDNEDMELCEIVVLELLPLILLFTGLAYRDIMNCS